MKNPCNFGVGGKKTAKCLTKWILEGLGLHLEGGWDGPGPPSGHFWALFGRYLGVLNQPFFKHRSKMGSKTPFGSILEGFWEDSGRICGGFREGLGRICEDFLAFQRILGMYLGKFS